MPRIRSVKPELWSDQDLAKLSRDARLLYIALWNMADEHARLQGDPRWVKGHCLPYDDDLGPTATDGLLDELAAGGKVVRYTVAGDPFLYLPKLAQHQRLDPVKVPSRLPAPEDADPVQTSTDPVRTESVPTYDPYAQTHESPGQTANDWISAPGADSSVPGADSSAPIVAKQVAGSREHDASGREQVAGVPPSAARTDQPTSAKIIGEWIERCPKRPPKPVVGQAAKLVGQMLAEGIDPDDVRRGMAAWQAKGLHPSTLPSVVNEVMNAPARAPNGHRPSTTDQRVAAGLALADRYREEETHAEEPGERAAIAGRRV